MPNSLNSRNLASLFFAGKPGSRTPWIQGSAVELSKVLLKLVDFAYFYLRLWRWGDDTFNALYMWSKVKSVFSKPNYNEIKKPI